MYCFIQQVFLSVLHKRKQLNTFFFSSPPNKQDHRSQLFTEEVLWQYGYQKKIFPSQQI